MAYSTATVHPPPHRTHTDYSHSIASQLSWCSVTRPPQRSRTVATRCARAASSSDASACPRVCRQPCGAACPVIRCSSKREGRTR
eukprot:scaffold90266_cov55-Phaeocystis_antarctica.AAC.2